MGRVGFVFFFFSYNFLLIKTGVDSLAEWKKGDARYSSAENTGKPGCFQVGSENNLARKWPADIILVLVQAIF